MKFDYKIESGDFLEFQLFTAAKDDVIQKRKIKGWIFLTIAFAILALFSFMKSSMYLGAYFALLAVVSSLFYPRYFKWKYKKQYGNFILRNYSKRFGEPAELEITKTHILSKDKVAEGKVKLSEIEVINETRDHFFIKISTGMSFIIPKREIDASIDLKSEFEKIGLKINEQLDWAW